MTAITANNLSGTYYGIGVIDHEEGAVAATHDRHHALTALHEHYRATRDSRLADWCVNAQGLQQGWAWMEETQGRALLRRSVGRPDHADAFPATWLCR